MIIHAAVSDFVAFCQNDMRKQNRMKDIQRMATTELRRRGEGALEKLEPSLTHEEAAIRLAAASALLPTHPEKARAVLEEILQNAIWPLAFEAKGVLRWEVADVGIVAIGYRYT